MTEAIAFQRPTAVALPWRLVRLLPGVALLFAIGYAGKLSEALLRDYGKAHHLALPNIEYVLWAIVFGMVIANTVGGSSICGVSAIIAAKGAIEADDDDATFAIAAILALGAFGLFAYPALGHLLHMSDHAFGVWAGLAVDNTAEAAAAGAIYSDAAGKVAVLTKSTRNAMIGFVGLGYAIYWASRGPAKAVANRAAFVWQKFPKFVLGFLFVSALATAGAFEKEQVASLANVSRWAFLLPFARVGLETDLREPKEQGVRPAVGGGL